MLNLLIVEDEELLRIGLTTYMNWEKLGYIVKGQASNGKEALEILERENIDVVITDIRMPLMTGIELSEIIYEKYPLIKVVIVSGYDDFEYARSALRFGVVDYLLKPINLKKLDATMIKIAEQFSEERKHAEELNRLQNVAETSFKSVINKIINDIFVLDLSYEELRKKQIPLELEEKYFSIIIVGIENFASYINEYTNLELLELDKNFGSIIKSLQREVEQIYVLQEQLCERIICVYGDSEEEILNIIKNLETEITNKQIENMKGTVFKGSIGKGIFKIKQSYSIARNNWKVIQENYWDISPILSKDGNNEHFTFFSYDSSRIKSAIRSGEEEEILSELEEFYKKLRKGNINLYLQWVMIFNNLYREIIKLPDEIGVKVDDIIGNPDILLKKMISERKRDTMMDNLRNISIKIGNEFKKTGQGRKKDILNKALEYIDDNYHKEDFTIGDVSKNIYVSSSYLSLLFREELGKTFIEILSDIRMEHAKNLLLNTNLKSYEVGEKCGYSNPSYFSTVFKGYYGCSPSKFKKKN